MARVALASPLPILLTVSLALSRASPSPSLTTASTLPTTSSVTSPSCDVRDWGAVGDGRDDTAAIQTALDGASCDEVVFASGVAFTASVRGASPKANT